MFDSFINPGVPAPVFWFFVALGVLIQAVSKTGFAGGLAILSIPVMMLVMPPEKVTATLLPLLVLMDLNAIYHHRKNKIWSHIWAIYIPSLAGIAAGAAIWWWMGRNGVEKYAVHLKRFVGVVAVGFALYIFARERALAWASRRRPGRGSAVAAGTAAGFVSTLTHGAGPIVSLYVYSLGLGRSLFVGTVAWTFMMINLTKLPVYCAVGLIERKVLLFDLALVWIIPFGSWFGHWLHLRVSEPLFNRILGVLVFVAGVQLLSGVDIVLLAMKAIQ